MIQLRDISLDYGDRHILHGLNAHFAQGRITAVMGPNGCGKTSLLRLVGGLLPPSAGQVLVEDRPVGTYGARELARRIAFVRQQPQADFEFSAFDTVLMGRNPYQRRLQNESQEDRDIVEHCMRQTGIWHLRQARLGQMSGGELQRVMIARALAQTTPVLLMDEPVSNLDISHQIEVMRLLRDAGEKTVLIVLHDLNLALRFCDDLLLLHDCTAYYHGPVSQGLTPDNIVAVYGVRTHLSDGSIVFDY